MIRLAFPACIATLLSGAICTSAAVAAPAYVPQSDAEVLERVTIERRGSAALKALRQQRAALAAKLDDSALAAAFARQAIELGRMDADPRYFGYAESALAPWWTQDAPPEDIRLLRATLRQQRHDFTGALADLDALIAADGSNAQARLTRAVIRMVQGQPRGALRDCAGLIGRSGLLTMSACIAQAQSLLGDAAAGPRLEAVIDDPHTVPAPGERLWALTVAAEVAQRRGDRASADPRFEQARRELAEADQRDPYLLVADADRLLDEDRAAEARERLAEATRIDNALLRLALAEQALNDPALADHVRLLQARFDETRQRGDTVHLREEALFELRLRKDAKSALALAVQNWQTQREPIDARVLIDAALAANEPQAAKPALGWMRENGIADPALRERAARLQAAGVAP